jgi:type VI secretion system protein ImpA
MPDLAFDVEALSSPLGEGSPAGDDLEYEPAFIALEQAGAGKPERQYGDSIFPAEPPDWPAVHEHATALAARTRDLRVAVWLTRCGARMAGLDGVCRGLELVHSLLDHLWASVHPQLDAADSDDPTMRMNALAPLADATTGLADLRAAAIAPVRGAITVRDLELALAGAEAAAGETVPTEPGVLQALQDLLARQPQAAAAARGALAAAESIVALLAERVGQDRAPDLEPLLALLRCVDRAVARARGVDEAAASAEDDGAVAGAPSGGAPSGIRNRADAVRELERVCDWIERNEPSNPAPLLIRRAQRLMNKSFIEIVRDLAPSGVDQVELIAGPQG